MSAHLLPLVAEKARTRFHGQRPGTNHNPLPCHRPADGQPLAPKRGPDAGHQRPELPRAAHPAQLPLRHPWLLVHRRRPEHFFPPEDGLVLRLVLQGVDGILRTKPSLCRHLRESEADGGRESLRGENRPPHGPDGPTQEHHAGRVRTAQPLPLRQPFPDGTVGQEVPRAAGPLQLRHRPHGIRPAVPCL